MHYSSETGICEYVTYERYCEDIDEKNEIIKKLERQKSDLEDELQEHKEVINQLKNLCEGILKNERHD